MLIRCTFVVRIWHKQVFSWCGSYKTQVLSWHSSLIVDIFSVILQNYFSSAASQTCHVKDTQYETLPSYMIITSHLPVLAFNHKSKCQVQMSRLMTKPTKWLVHPAKTQITLGVRPDWSESSLCAHWVAKDPMFLHAKSEDSDQTGQMPRLIWVFVGCTCHFVCFVMRRLRFYFVASIQYSLLILFWHNSISCIIN